MSIGYEQVYQLRTGDFDRYRHVQPASVLDVFQDAAGVNAESMPNMDLAFMDAHELLWVVTRIGYDVLAQPTLHEQVKVRTWPLAPTRKGFQREYVMESLGGRELLKGSSDWIVMDAKTRAFVPARETFGTQGDYSQRTALGRKLRKIAPFEPTGQGRSLTPTFCDLDMNGHVNNTRYAAYALDALHLDEHDVIQSFQIDFRHELLEGKPVSVHTSREGTTARVMGMQEDAVSFMCLVQLA